MIYPEELRKIKETARERARKILALPSPPPVEAQIYIETAVIRERWWKQGGFVFHQVNDDPPEITPYAHVPFVILKFDPPPWEDLREK